MSVSVTIGQAIAKEGFKMSGTSARTTNAAEMSGNGVIGAQWGQFFGNQVMEKIANRKNDTILAVYTDYESDETGAYTYVLGAEIAEAGQDKELRTIAIPDQKYVVFTTRKGPVPEVVVEAWQEIWSWSKHNERAFVADFEVYDGRASDPANSQVDIYISIK
ncbi:GyrI-like domain-containing protein [Paenibacillus methanolicus]|uniref:Putative transcriptional regulator YdeE n=1 Tax=Paenibacillus methanolicus TaxID=582686 RepID=A0A5S5CHW7_9BACL|nr:GyrI-like domain-containing protein [Paenibacillus methanolicus]TYP79124.1 putative transcriptional regulator YdeE [Paenibacillus methanolicus]